MEINKKAFRHLLLGAAGCIILYWVLHEPEQIQSVINTLQKVLSPFILGATLAFILNVPMRSFEQVLRGIKNDRFRRVIALLLTFVAVILVLALVFGLLIPQVSDTADSIAQRLPGFIDRSYQNVMNFLNDNPELLEWVNLNTDFEKLDISGIIEKGISIAEKSFSTIVSGAFTAIGGFASFLVNFVIGLVFAVYCLFQKEILARQGRKVLYAFLPENWGDYIVRVLRLANSTFSNFLSGQCIEVLILGVMFAISMAIFRMPYIPLVSVLVAVTAFIPLVGAFVGCAIGALLILVNNPLQAVFFVIMFLVLQQIEGNLIYPRVVGTSIGLPGMWVLVAVALGGQMMGVIGMFLMIPMASVLYAMLREIVQNRLTVRKVPADKLINQPPELRSHFKVKRESSKKKKQLKNKEAKSEKAPPAE